jgi:hypothetical protein
MNIEEFNSWDQRKKRGKSRLNTEMKSDSSKLFNNQERRMSIEEIIWKLKDAKISFFKNANR